MLDVRYHIFLFIIPFHNSYRFSVYALENGTNYKTDCTEDCTIYVLIINYINTKVVCVLDVQEEQEPGGGG